MIGQHYGLRDIPRSEVLPGTAVKYRDRIYRASANVKNGLYIHSVIEKTVIKSDIITILLNGKGEPLIN
ncbi:cell division protein FtsZ [Klebsiella pneumoniae]|uniref:cell division protein FtsZ n=1 Tax=Klebsiella pneumoniae TaxID=573 RepID=UPI00254AFB8B|nr:cell division protein FtsZ [Klebsiella pneumoniae]MDK7826284.1 cell division protein FtsZ [Klebsiella pneumoniae]MDT4383084.1 cell division protein FtsZ [Klebsiella pneumoniae]HBS7433509.1 cell division protein FtsZ [Klebsiella pneumoniae]HBW3410130.1 cell division protein FtsZ [Klebsiella pneumoniae]